MRNPFAVSQFLCTFAAQNNTNNSKRYMTKKLKKVLVLGSGALKIGQAGELPFRLLKVLPTRFISNPSPLILLQRSSRRNGPMAFC